MHRCLVKIDANVSRPIIVLLFVKQAALKWPVEISGEDGLPR